MAKFRKKPVVIEAVPAAPAPEAPAGTDGVEDPQVQLTRLVREAKESFRRIMANGAGGMHRANCLKYLRNMLIEHIADAGMEAAAAPAPGQRAGEGGANNPAP